MDLSALTAIGEDADDIGGLSDLFSEEEQATPLADGGRAASMLGTESDGVRGGLGATVVKKFTDFTLSIKGAETVFVAGENLRDPQALADMDRIDFAGKSFYGVMGKDSKKDAMLMTMKTDITYRLEETMDVKGKDPVAFFKDLVAGEYAKHAAPTKHTAEAVLALPRAVKASATPNPAVQAGGAGAAAAAAAATAAAATAAGAGAAHAASGGVAAAAAASATAAARPAAPAEDVLRESALDDLGVVLGGRGRRRSGGRGRGRRGLLLAMPGEEEDQEDARANSRVNAFALKVAIDTCSAKAEQHLLEFATADWAMKVKLKDVKALANLVVSKLKIARANEHTCHDSVEPAQKTADSSEAMQSFVETWPTYCRQPKDETLMALTQPLMKIEDHLKRLGKNLCPSLEMAVKEGHCLRLMADGQTSEAVSLWTDTESLRDLLRRMPNIITANTNPDEIDATLDKAIRKRRDIIVRPLSNKLQALQPGEVKTHLVMLRDEAKTLADSLGDEIFSDLKTLLCKAELMFGYEDHRAIAVKQASMDLRRADSALGRAVHSSAAGRMLSSIVDKYCSRGATDNTGDILFQDAEKLMQPATCGLPEQLLTGKEELMMDLSEFDNEEKLKGLSQMLENATKATIKVSGAHETWSKVAMEEKEQASCDFVNSVTGLLQVGRNVCEHWIRKVADCSQGLDDTYVQILSGVEVEIQTHPSLVCFSRAVSDVSKHCGPLHERMKELGTALNSLVSKTAMLVKFAAEVRAATSFTVKNSTGSIPVVVECLEAMVKLTSQVSNSESVADVASSSDQETPCSGYSTWVPRLIQGEQEFPERKHWIASSTVNSMKTLTQGTWCVDLIKKHCGLSDSEAQLQALADALPVLQILRIPSADVEKALKALTDIELPALYTSIFGKDAVEEVGVGNDPAVEHLLTASRRFHQPQNLVNSLPHVKNMEIIIACGARAPLSQECLSPLLNLLHAPEDMDELDQFQKSSLLRLAGSAHALCATMLAVLTMMAPDKSINVRNADGKLDMGKASILQCMQYLIGFIEQYLQSESMQKPCMATITARMRSIIQFMSLLRDRLGQSVKSSVVDLLQQTQKKLQCASPQWSTFLSDTKMDRTLMETQLIQYEGVAELPALVEQARNLHASVEPFGKQAGYPSWVKDKELQKAMTQLSMAQQHASLAVRVKAAATIVVRHEGKASGKQLAVNYVYMTGTEGLPAPLKSAIEKLDAGGAAKRKAAESKKASVAEKKQKT